MIAIKPYSKNAKKHTKKQIEQVANSIKEFGMHQPIVVDKQGVIIVGHGRYEAIKSLGWEVKPEWVKVADLTEEQANAYRLADNKLNESEWDMGLVIEELKGLSDPMFELTGFDKDLIIEPDEKDDEVPPVPEAPVSKIGDLYELGGHRVLCGNSIQLDTVSGLMGGIRSDMVFTDPPYLMNFDGSVHKDGSKSRNSQHGVIKNDKMSKEDGEQFLYDIATTIRAFNNGAFYITFYRLGIDWIMNACTKAGLKWRNLIIWKKNNHNLSNSDYKSLYEPMIVGWADDYVPVLYGWGQEHDYYGKKSEKDVWEQKLPSIWEIDRTSNNDLHPTMKPVELMLRAILNSSKSGGIVLDLFLGSGSTLIASHKTGRVCYGMELDPKYVDVIVQRYVDFTGNENIIKNGKPIIWSKTKVEDPQ